MYKKLHKNLEKLLGQEVLDEEGALLASGLILAQAFKEASQRGDTAIMLDISDRWILLSKMLSGESPDEEDGAISFKGPLGFLASLDTEEEEDDNTPEGPDKGPSGFKVCKKPG